VKLLQKPVDKAVQIGVNHQLNMIYTSDDIMNFLRQKTRSRLKARYVPFTFFILSFFLSQYGFDLFFA